MSSVDTFAFEVKTDIIAGQSHKCAPCKHSTKEHYDRHRNIASLLRQLKELRAEHESPSPKVPIFGDENLSTPSPISKKDRKAAKKAAKVADMPKVLTAAEVDLVARTLHPHDYEMDKVEAERRLVEDPDIIDNLYFHRGTSNTREVRYRHLEHKQADKGLAIIQESEIDALLADLHVPATDKLKTKAERMAVEAIRKAVRDAMEQTATERDETTMRKAGFWRWASKKTYKKLVANGSIWEHKADNSETPKRKDSGFPKALNVKASLIGDKPALKTVSSPGTIADSSSLLSPTTFSGPRRKVAIAGSAASTRLSISGTKAQASDEWTTVGKAEAVKKPVGKLTFSGNGGLTKLQVKVPGKFGALTLIDAEESDGEDY